MSVSPQEVARQLLNLTGPRIGRRDVDAMRVIERAANALIELSVRRKSASQSAAVLRREREQFQLGRLPRVGYVVRHGEAGAMAATLADLIDGPCDLYRTSTGGVRVVRAGEKVKTGEYLGRFDDGATVDDIKEALEHE